MQLNLFNIKDTFKDSDGTTQVCKLCLKELDIALFHNRISNISGIDTRCKTCFKKDTDRKSLVVDHDHDTLEFRGWLCESCNLGIGLLGDTVAGTEKALTFLRKHYER